MRQLLRAGVLALILVFGIPAAALLLAHLGLIALPQDAYSSSVTEISPAESNDDYARGLGRLDTLDTPRTVVARAAIGEAAAHLPGHREGVDREWEFYRVSRSGFTSRWTTDALASARVRCDGCSAEREARVMVSARVVALHPDRAEVALHWSLARERSRSYARSGARLADTVTDRGSITIDLELAAGEWRALQLEPRR